MSRLCHFRRRLALGEYYRNAESDEQREFLLGALTGVWERLEQLQCLREVANGLKICRALEGALARLLPVGNRLGIEPRLCAVMGQQFGLGSADSESALLTPGQSVDGTPVACSPTTTDTPPPGEGAFERHDAVSNTRRFVEQLHCLKVGQAPLKHRRGNLCDSLEQGHGDIPANDRRHLQQLLLLRWQTVDAGGQHRLDRGGQHHRGRAVAQLHGRPANSSRKRGFPSACARMACTTTSGTATVRMIACTSSPAVARPQPHEGQLGGVGPVDPSGPIPRSVGQQQQDAGVHQPLHQRREHLFGARVDPVQVLDLQDERALARALKGQLHEGFCGCGL